MSVAIIPHRTRTDHRKPIGLRLRGPDCAAIVCAHASSRILTPVPCPPNAEPSTLNPQPLDDPAGELSTTKHHSPAGSLKARDARSARRGQTAFSIGYRGPFRQMGDSVMLREVVRMRSPTIFALAVAFFATAQLLAKPPAANKTVALDVRPGDARSVVSAVEIIDGKIVCAGGQEGDDEYQAVLWEVTAAGAGYDVTTYDLVGGQYAVAMNSSGEAVGVYDTLNQDLLYVTRGLCWTDPGAEPIQLSPLYGDSGVEPHAINAAGVILGRSLHKYRTLDEEGNDIVVETITAAAWRIGEVNAQGELVAVDLSNGSEEVSTAFDINDCDGAGMGQVVGFDGFAGGTVTWDLDCSNGLPVPAGPQLLVYHGIKSRINNLGDVSGERYNLPYRLLADGTFEELSVPRRATARICDINDQRQVVGQVSLWNRSGGFVGNFGALWRADGKLIDLDTLVGRDWFDIYRGKAITSNGIIAAEGAQTADSGVRAMLIIPQ